MRWGRLFTVMACAGFVSACAPQWHFAIMGINQAANPQFCVSVRVQCAGPGVKVKAFTVYGVQPATNEHHIYWAIRAIDDVPLHRFDYGVTPKGYDQTRAPEPLQSGMIYSVGHYWFKKEGGDAVRYESTRAYGLQ